MPALVYPDSLPCPQRASFQRTDTRALSSIAGLRRSRTLYRDRGGSEPVQFLMTFAQVQTWLEWISNEQVEGGAWFAATWRLPSGRNGVYRFMDSPSYPEFVPVVGWRVTANVEVRGRGMAPQSHVAFTSLFHHHFDRPDDATNWTDVQGKVWTPHVATPGGTLDQSGPAKFGAGAFYARNDTGSVPNIDTTYPNVPLDVTGLNRFTVRYWITPGGGVSAVGIGALGLAFLRVEIQSGAAFFRGEFSTGSFSIGGTGVSGYAYVEGNYDGVNLRLFGSAGSTVSMIAKQAMPPGLPILIASGYVGQTSTSPGDEVRIDEAQFINGRCMHPSDASFAVPTSPFRS